MPMYAYKCENCENSFEVKQRMLDEPLRECILCNEGRVRRVINNVGIVFKGNGFYVTDTRKAVNGAAKPESSKDTKAEKDTSPPVKEKKETKSEPAEPAKKPAAATATA